MSINNHSLFDAKVGWLQTNDHKKSSNNRDHDKMTQIHQNFVEIERQQDPFSGGEGIRTQTANRKTTQRVEEATA